MTRNTKEISLIQIRTGDLANLPKALHQSEFGLAKDVNRLFIGNASNTTLANRTAKFPYQNLEVLTEYSDLKDYFKYSYANNIKNVGKDTVRSDYKEYLPIVVTCTKANPSIDKECSIIINGDDIKLPVTTDIETIIDSINGYSEQTHTYATMLPGTQVITLVCFATSLYVEDNENGAILSQLGFPSSYDADILMPVRKVTEKLDDFLNISDFGVQGDGITNNAGKIFNSLIEVYKNCNDPQFFRNVLFPAGTYMFDIEKIDGNTTYRIDYPFPLISNLRVHGEGIDRTIIEANVDYSGILLNCVDDNLTIESSDTYALSQSYPNNIVIEDMTFKSVNQICKISSATNITFNRVKFVGLGNSRDLIQIIGRDGYNSSNISFNECIFEGGYHSISIPSFAQNIHITNCQFIGSEAQAIKIGEEGHVYGVNLTSNTFTRCYKNASKVGDNAIIQLYENAEYVSIHQSIFDKDVIERKGYIIPYKDYDGEDRRNFIDTLDPKTGDKKILRFNFTQPQWEYINYLCNSNGKVVLAVDGQDSDITATNGLNITHTDTSVTLKSVGVGDVIVEQADDSNLILGKGSEGNSKGSIILNKTLDINGNTITNENHNSNIVFKPYADKYLEIKPNTLTDQPYEQAILGKPNAIPNVAYVENASTSSVLFNLSSQSLNDNEGFKESNNSKMNLLTFDSATYGDYVYLKNISINVKHPFYKSYELRNKAVEYVEGCRYYKGEVVRGVLKNSMSIDGVVLETHTAEGDFDYAVKTQKIISTLSDKKEIEIIENDETNVETIEHELKDVCYIDIVATNGSDKLYSLTKKYIVDYKNFEEDNFGFSADISACNTFHYNPSEFNKEQIYGDRNRLVKYQDKIFVINEFENDDEPSTLTPLDLHNTSIATKKHSEGYNYIYDMERTILDINGEPTEMTNINMKDMTLYVIFADANGEQIYSLTDATQLCPGGEATIRIEYIKKGIFPMPKEEGNE